MFPRMRLFRFGLVAVGIGLRELEIGLARPLRLAGVMTAMSSGAVVAVTVEVVLEDGEAVEGEVSARMAAAESRMDGTDSLSCSKTA